MTDPTELPDPYNAALVAYDETFIRLVSVALMHVALNDPPDIGEPGRNMIRYIVANPREQAARFAVGLASDPYVIARAMGQHTGEQLATGEQISELADRIRVMWPVMAGESGHPGGVEGPGTGATPAFGKGG